MKEYVIALDIGASKVKTQLIDRRGEVYIDKLGSLVGQKPNNSSLLELMAKHIQETLDSSSSEQIGAISIAAPGQLDTIEGTIKASPNLKEIKNFPIVHEVRRKFPDQFVYLLNDADAAGLGEFWFGKGREHKNIVLITLGTGVGSAVIADEELQTGLGMAAEWGHISLVVGDEKRTCGCGAINCAESFLGTDGLAESYSKVFNKKVSGNNFEEKHELSYKMREGVAKKEEKWLRLQREYARHFAYLARNIIVVHQPEVIIISGGIAFENPALLNEIENQITEIMDPQKDNMSIMAKGVDIALASLENAANLGAAQYAFDKVSQ